MSLLACLFDTYFPTPLSYLLQLVALAGFGQLYVSRAFISIFTVDIRFWYSIVYLLAFSACVLAINAYLLIKKKLAGGIVYLGGVTVPTIFSSIFFLSVFVNNIPIPLAMLPRLPKSFLYNGAAICIVILCSGIALSFRPEIFTKIRAPASTEVAKAATPTVATSRQSTQLHEERIEAVLESDIATPDEKTAPAQAAPSPVKKKKKKKKKRKKKKKKEAIEEGPSSPVKKKKKRKKKKKKKKKKLPLSYMLDQEQVLDQATSPIPKTKESAQDGEARE